MECAQKVALGSVVVGLIVLGLKFGAYWLTGSVALYSDALESTINVVAAGAAFSALRISAKPADSDHPYGYYTAEYF
jgi:divalent metal cation (Fe/Co/Zn/Cd) transporter